MAMRDVVMMIIVFCIYIISFYVSGFLLEKVSGANKRCSQQYLPIGMFVYTLVFFVYIIPLKKMQVSLHTAAYIWLGIWLCGMGIILFFFHKELWSSCIEWAGKVRKNKCFSIPLIGITCLQILFEELYGRIVGGLNPAYYIGYVTTALHTDTMGMYDPWTGNALGNFSSSYFLFTYMDHSAVIDFLTDLHPLLEMRTVLPAITIIIGNLLVWEIAGTVCPKDRKRQFLFWGVYTAIFAFLAYSRLLAPFYSYFRAFEGKSIFANIALPLLFLLFWRLYDNPNDRGIVLCIMIVMIGSYMYCMSAMYILPIMLVGYFPMVLFKRDKRLLRNFVLFFVPHVIVVIYYFLIQKGIISLTIHW